MKIVSSVLIFLVPLWSYAFVDYQVTNGSEPTACLAPSSEELLQSKTCTAINDDNEISNLSVATNNILGDSINRPQVCQDKFFEENGLSKGEQKEIKNQLQKLCFEQFQKHKKQFALQLLKKGRIFKSLGLLLKNKKKYAKVRRISKEDYTISAEAEQLEQLNAQIRQEEAKVLAALRQELGESEDGKLELQAADTLYSDNGKILKPQYHYQLASENEIGAIFIDSPETSCRMKIERPELSPPNPELNPLLPPLDLLDSFPDDCALMYNDTFSIKDAKALVADTQNDPYCSQNQKLDEKLKTGSPIVKTKWKKTKESMHKTIERLNQISDQFVLAAEKKMTPSFLIKTTRNLYSDKVRPLAGKRAEFVRKYLYQRIKDLSQIKPRPEWLEDYEKFSQVVEIEHPKYQGMNSKEQVGSYGPDPMASKQQQQAEIKNLKINLASARKKDEEAKQKYQEIIAEQRSALSDPTTGINQQVLTLENELAKAEKIINKTQYTDISNFQSQKDDYQQKIEALAQLKFQKQAAEQKLSESQKMYDYFEKKLAKQDPDKKAAELLQFYQNRPENFNNGTQAHWDFKKTWDDKLFKDFKMAQVEGQFMKSGDFDPEIDLADLNPKIKYLISKNIEMRGFKCEYKISDIKRSRKRYRKGNRNWPRLFWNIPIKTITFSIATPFIPFAWLGKKIGYAIKRKPVCNRSKFRFKPYKQLNRWADRNITFRKKGSKGYWYTDQLTPIPYENNSEDMLPLLQESLTP